jgi:hypothetical protein
MAAAAALFNVTAERGRAAAFNPIHRAAARSGQ